MLTLTLFDGQPNFIFPNSVVIFTAEVSIKSNLSQRRSYFVWATLIKNGKPNRELMFQNYMYMYKTERARLDIHNMKYFQWQFLNVFYNEFTNLKNKMCITETPPPSCHKKLIHH